MSKEQDTFIPVPGGEAITLDPNGIQRSNGFDPQHNLYDNNRRPKLPSGDWQVRPPDLAPRGRP